MNMHEYARQAREIADAKIACGTWAKVGQSHYRRETGEEVKQAHGRFWDIIRDGKVRNSYLSRYEAMHQVDRKYEAAR